MTARPRLRGAGHTGPHCCRVCHSCADVGLLLGPTSTSPPLPPQHNSTATQARRSEYVLEVFIDYKMCYALKFSSYFVHEPALFSGRTCHSADNRQHGLVAHVLLDLWILLMSQWHKLRLERRQLLQDSLNEGWLHRWLCGWCCGPCLPVRWHNCQCVSRLETVTGAGLRCGGRGAQGRQRSGPHRAIIIRPDWLQGAPLCLRQSWAWTSEWIVKTRNCTKLRGLISRKWGLYI